MIQERVRAGLARARSEGKHVGRPPIAPELEQRIRDALKAGAKRTQGCSQVRRQSRDSAADQSPFRGGKEASNETTALRKIPGRGIQSS